MIFKLRNRHLLTGFTAVILLFVSVITHAQSVTGPVTSTNNLIQIPLGLPPGPDGIVPDGIAQGTVSIANNPSGPDQIGIYASGLEPLTRFTVFLTNSRTLGALPAHLIGEFATNELGVGILFVESEAVNAFATVGAGNTAVVDQFAAGAIANGTTSVPLDWVRIYRAATNGTVNSIFGGSENEIGGGNVLTSVRPIIPNNIINTNVCNYSGFVTFMLQIDDNGLISNGSAMNVDPTGCMFNAPNFFTSVTDPAVFVISNPDGSIFLYGDINGDNVVDLLPSLNSSIIFQTGLPADTPKLDLFSFVGGSGGTFNLNLNGFTLTASTTPVFSAPVLSTAPASTTPVRQP